MHSWRRWVLKVFGARVGRGTAIYPSAKIWAPWNLETGEHVTIGDGVDLYTVDRISIGSRSIISQRAFLCAAEHDITSPTFDLVTGSITIGQNVWVAAEAMIGAGVIVADSAVVAARSVVFQDVGPSEIVAGNPAGVISKRPSEAANMLRHL